MKRTFMIEKMEYFFVGAAILAVGVGIIWAIMYASGAGVAPLDRLCVAGLVIGLAYLFHEHTVSSETERRNLMSAVRFYKYDRVEVVSTDRAECKDMIGRQFIVQSYDRLSGKVRLSRGGVREYEFKPNEVRLAFRSPVGQRLDADEALAATKASTQSTTPAFKAGYFRSP